MLSHVARPGWCYSVELLDPEFDEFDDSDFVLFEHLAHGETAVSGLLITAPPKPHGAIGDVTHCNINVSRFKRASWYEEPARANGNGRPSWYIKATEAQPVPTYTVPVPKIELPPEPPPPPPPVPDLSPEEAVAVAEQWREQYPVLVDEMVKEFFDGGYYVRCIQAGWSYETWFNIRLQEKLEA